MAATPVNYTRTTGDVQVVQFDTSSVEAMEDVRDWVIANLPQDTPITLQTAMGGTLFWPGESVYPGDCIVKNANGKLISLPSKIVNAFFDEA